MLYTQPTANCTAKSTTFHTGREVCVGVRGKEGAGSVVGME